LSDEQANTETTTATMRRFVHVHLSDVATPILCDPGDVEVDANDFCVIQDAEGTERVGFVSSRAVLCERQCETREISRILRRAEPADVRAWHFLHRRETEALVICKEMVQKHKLDMKITRVRFEDRQHKTIFYFTADKRVDFRDLVKDLAVQFRARIELWQVGVRDEAKACGGLGCCGRPMCCATWMRDFIPVSIRFAKSQDIQFSPTKLAGVCGRLRCCLAYEQEQYAEMGRGVPAIGCITESEEFGRGKIIDRNLLSRTATITTEEGKYVTVPLARLRRLLPQEEATFVKPGQNPAKVWRVIREGDVPQAPAAAAADPYESDSRQTTETAAAPEAPTWQYDERRPGLEDDEEQPETAGPANEPDEGKDAEDQPGEGKPRRRRRRGRRSGPGKGTDAADPQPASAPAAPAAAPSPAPPKGPARGPRRPHSADREQQPSKGQTRQAEAKTLDRKPGQPQQHARQK
jgi:cell fate regulator YaaT (PSP1 superfamily)